MSDRMVSLSGLRKGVMLFALLLAFAFPASGVAHAATAEVTGFNVELVTTPTTLHKMWYAYNGSWSGSPRVGTKTITWYQNNNPTDPLVSTASHGTSPFSVSTTEYTIPRSSGSGNFYEITVSVSNFQTYQTYASSTKQDGDFSN